MKVKITIKLELDCDKCRNKALQIAAEVAGVSSVSIEGEDRDRLVVIGENVDTVCLGKLLRKKFRCVVILSVEQVKPPKPPEPPKPPKPKSPKKVCIVPCEPCSKCKSPTCYGQCKPCWPWPPPPPPCHGQCPPWSRCPSCCIIVKCPPPQPCCKCESPRCHGQCKPCSKCHSHKCDGQCGWPPPPPPCHGQCPPWSGCPSCCIIVKCPPPQPWPTPCGGHCADSNPDGCSIL